MKYARKVLAAAMLTIATAAAADNYAYLTIGSSNGSQSYEVGAISRITFDAEHMILWNGQTETARLPLATLDKMFFSQSASTGLTSLHASGTECISVKDGVLRVKTVKGQHVTLYNIKGTAVQELTADNVEAVISLNGLSKGVYVVKVGEESTKVVNK